MKNIRIISKKYFYIVLAFLLGLILFGMFTSCKYNGVKYPAENIDNRRFQVTYTQWLQESGYVNILIDKNTNAKYLFYKCSYGAGLTKLEE